MAKQYSFFKENSPQEIISSAIEHWKPRAIVALFSGGYDSMVVTHLVHTLDTSNIPIQVWSIDTQLAADGWREYVSDIANQFGWDFNIHDNKKGFGQFITLVAHAGCPKTRKMHTFVYQKLKERSMDAIHMLHKTKVSDKTLFISGSRRAESSFRKSAAEVSRVGKSNKIFAAPIVHWSNEECNMYRLENELPNNPFYSTVRGSGDCQCNWGDFIDLETLMKYSPELAAGNVALINWMSKDLHGFGWHSNDMISGFQSVLDSPICETELSSPFLCQGCSRSKVRTTTESIESLALQRGMLF